MGNGSRHTIHEFTRRRERIGNNMMGNDRNKKQFIDSPKPIHDVDLAAPYLLASDKDLQKFYHTLKMHLCQVQDIPASTRTTPGGRVVPVPSGVRVTFPEGTTQQEMYPRGSDARFLVVLPDGLVLLLIDHEGSYRLSQVVS